MDKQSLKILKEVLRKRKLRKEDDPNSSVRPKNEYAGGVVINKMTGKEVPTEGGGSHLSPFKEYIGGKIERKDNYYDDVTEKLYQEWKRTGTVKQEGMGGLNNRTNTLIQEFMKRKKKEGG